MATPASSSAFCVAPRPQRQSPGSDTHPNCCPVHLILLPKACWSSSRERKVRVTLTHSLRLGTKDLLPFHCSGRVSGLRVSCVMSVLSKAPVLHSWLHVRACLPELSVLMGGLSSLIYELWASTLFELWRILTEGHIISTCYQCFHMDPHACRASYLTLKKLFFLLPIHTATVLAKVMSPALRIGGQAVVPQMVEYFWTHSHCSGSAITLILTFKDSPVWVNRAE